MSRFLAWGDFHARSRFTRSTIPEEKWGTTRSVVQANGALFARTGACTISCLRLRHSNTHTATRLALIRSQIFQLKRDCSQSTVSGVDKRLKEGGGVV